MNISKQYSYQDIYNMCFELFHAINDILDLEAASKNCHVNMSPYTGDLMVLDQPVSNNEFSGVLNNPPSSEEIRSFFEKQVRFHPFSLAYQSHVHTETQRKKGLLREKKNFSLVYLLILDLSQHYYENLANRYPLKHLSHQDLFDHFYQFVSSGWKNYLPYWILKQSQISPDLYCLS